MTEAAANIDSNGAYVLREEADGVVWLTLNRPHELNALSEGMLAALQAELDALAVSETARVVVLSGSGRAFCAGHNLKEMRANYTLDYQRELFRTCSRMMTSIMNLPQPVIARVQGLATAAGCQLVATCDLAIASREARLATSGINVGLFCSTPGVALSRAVARKHAMHMLMTGEFVDADTAAAMGLVNQAVDAGALDAAVGELAGTLAQKSRHALALGKRAFYRQLEMGVEEAYDYAGRVMAENMMDRDAAEGIDAFSEKRPARWDQTPRD